MPEKTSYTVVHRAFIVVPPSFLNPASLLVQVSALQYPSREQTTIGEELRNVLNTARAILAVGRRDCGSFSWRPWGLLKTISRTVLEALVSIGMAFRYMSGSRHR